jgi:hypothetical protein
MDDGRNGSIFLSFFVKIEKLQRIEAGCSENMLAP